MASLSKIIDVYSHAILNIGPQVPLANQARSPTRERYRRYTCDGEDCSAAPALYTDDEEDRSPARRTERANRISMMSKSFEQSVVSCRDRNRSSARLEGPADQLCQFREVDPRYLDPDLLPEV